MIQATSGRCYICEMPLGKKKERDHFPVPRRRGGEDVYDICLNCHDMKDRCKLDRSWDIADFLAPLVSLWERAEPVERLVLAKMFHVFADVHTMEVPR